MGEEDGRGVGLKVGEEGIRVGQSVGRTVVGE